MTRLESRNGLTNKLAQWAGLTILGAILCFTLVKIDVGASARAWLFFFTLMMLTWVGSIIASKGKVP